MKKLNDLLSQFRSMAMFEGYELTAPEGHGMDGDTPLHVIAMDGDLGLLKKIIQFVIEIDVVGDCGNTPLHYAVNWGYPEIAKILIDNGADPMRKNDYGDIPLVVMRERLDFQEIVREIERSSLPGSSSVS